MQNPNAIGIWPQVEAELNKEGLSDHVKRLYTEQLSREVRKSQPLVVTWETDRANDAEFFGLKPPEGSVTLYWANKESGLMKQLESAHVAHDTKRMERLHERLVADYKSRSVISVAKAVDMIMDSPSFFDLRYGSKTLARTLWLSRDAECGSMVFSYNGGKLEDSDFSIVEYTRKPDESAYEFLIVKSPPVLSAIEKRALDAVPQSELEENLAAAPLCIFICALVTIAVFVTINTAVTTCCAAFHERLRATALSPDDIERLGTVASARELLDMRRKVFMEFGLV